MAYRNRSNYSHGYGTHHWGGRKTLSPRGYGTTRATRTFSKVMFAGVTVYNNYPSLTTGPYSGFRATILQPVLTNFVGFSNYTVEWEYFRLRWLKLELVPWINSQVTDSGNDLLVPPTTPGAVWSYVDYRNVPGPTNVPNDVNTARQYAGYKETDARHKHVRFIRPANLGVLGTQAGGDALVTPVWGKWLDTNAPTMEYTGIIYGIYNDSNLNTSWGIGVTPPPVPPMSFDLIVSACIEFKTAKPTSTYIVTAIPKSLRPATPDDYQQLPSVQPQDDEQSQDELPDASQSVQAPLSNTELLQRMRITAPLSPMRQPGIYNKRP
jgi:hypothetical protein